MASDEANEKGRILLAKLCARDVVVVCGQASSHCVNFSARDLAAAWKRTTAGDLDGDIARRRMGSLVLLKDGMSPVTGFEVGGPPLGLTALPLLLLSFLLAKNVP